MLAESGVKVVMKTRNRVSLFGILIAAVITVTICGCGGGAANVPPSPISVSLSQTMATVQPRASAPFTATVSNDSSGKGVTWSMTCNGATCGSISPTATVSSSPATYTAPMPPVVTLMVTLTATSVADSTKSASVAITVPAPTSVSISPSSASVPSGGTQQFTPMVSNDPANAGVTWQVVAKLVCDGIFVGRCNPIGEAPEIFLPCSGCGTVSPASTASGAPMTYTAPVHLMPPSKPGYFFCGVCAGQVLVVATSVTYTASSATAYLTVLPISVSVSPGSSRVALNGTQQFSATVKNDGTNSGVNWTLTENGVACSPGCGTIAPISTASGGAATYSAAGRAPVGPVVSVTATSVEDPTKSASATVVLTTSNGSLACSAGSGSESLLKGQYAFLLQGDLANFGQGSLVGSIAADGTGKISAGEEDLIGPETVSIDTTASSYAVGPDHRGCLVLSGVNNGTTPPLSSYLSFSFSLGALNSSSVATGGHIVELSYSLAVGATEIEKQASAAGLLRLQDPASFTASQFNGNYAVGFIGSDQQTLQNGSRRVAIAGTLAADGVSAISSASFDINDVGTITINLSSAPAGTFTCCDANGRGALTLGNLRAPSVGFYVINSGDAFLVADDNNADAIQGVGEAVGIPPGTTFTQASLNGSSVLRETAQSVSGAEVNIATGSADGKAAMTVNDNLNNAGAFTTSSIALSYTVASNGRVTFTGGSTPPVIYLYGPNQGFLVGTDPDGTFGIVEPQAAGPFSNASFSGTYVFGTENPSANTATTESGVLTADANRNASGTVDQSNQATVPQSQNLSFTYSFQANGVGNVGNGTTAILISGNKLVFINNTTATPTITVVEK